MTGNANTKYLKVEENKMDEKEAKRLHKMLFKAVCHVCQNRVQYVTQFGTHRNDDHRAFRYECAGGHVTYVRFHQNCHECDKVQLKGE